MLDSAYRNTRVSPLCCLCLWWCCTVLASACATAPQGPDIGRLPIITSGDPKAEAELREARTARDAGKADTAKKRYRNFLQQHAQDPLVPIAELGSEESAA